MSDLRAGFGRSEITPRLGTELVGYNHRASGALGVHDPLLARALVLEQNGEQWAIISCDLCFVSHQTVRSVRAAVAARTAIPPERVLIAATHTHSGPDDLDSGAWDQSLADLIVPAVIEACAALQPAQIGSGFGVLYGYSINRRWLDRPIDPALGVIRVDALDGHPLGLLTNFGCHAVVMGPDNLQISADWPGQACRDLESTLGPESCCMFLPGGCGEINPLVAGVRNHLAQGRTVVSIGNISTYYGTHEDPTCWNIGDRRGGTFAEVSEMATAFAAEAMHVAQGIKTEPGEVLWSEQLFVDAARTPGEPYREIPRPWDAPDASVITDATGRIPAEVMLLGINGILLVSEPGEVFGETAVQLRTRLRLLGYSTPLLVGYANGRLDYLPEPEAFDEGGYEPTYPWALGISRDFQARVWKSVEPIARRHASAAKNQSRK